MKRLENNQAVLGQVVMWANLLSKQKPDLFNQNPFLVFGELKAFDFSAGVFDEAWLPHEEEAPSNDDDPESDDQPFKLLTS